MTPITEFISQDLADVLSLALHQETMCLETISLLEEKLAQIEMISENLRAERLKLSAYEQNKQLLINLIAQKYKLSPEDRLTEKGEIVRASPAVAEHLLEDLH